MCRLGHGCAGGLRRGASGQWLWVACGKTGRGLASPPVSGAGLGERVAREGSGHPYSILKLLGIYEKKLLGMILTYLYLWVRGFVLGWAERGVCGFLCVFQLIRLTWGRTNTLTKVRFLHTRNRSFPFPFFLFSSCFFSVNYADERLGEKLHEK